MKKIRLSSAILLVMTVIFMMMFTSVVHAEKISATTGKQVSEGYTGGRVGFTVHKPDIKHDKWFWNEDRFDLRACDLVIRNFMVKVLTVVKETY